MVVVTAPEAETPAESEYTCVVKEYILVYIFLKILLK